MAGIDLRIVFGADIKEADFERINSHLQKIQDQSKRLSDTLNKAGQDSASGMGRIVESLSSMGKTTDAIRNINSLTQSIQALSKTREGLGGLISNFTTLGQSINNATAQTINTLSRQRTADTDALRKSIAAKISSGPQIEHLMENAKAMNEPGWEDRLSKYNVSRVTEAAQGQAFITEKQLAAVSAQLSKFSNAIGISTAVIQGTGAGYDYMKFGGTRAYIAQEQLRLEIARRQVSGDITLPMMGNKGIGFFNEGQQQGGPGTIPTMQGFVEFFARNLMSLVTGNKTTTMTEILTRKMKERADLDEAKYEPLFGGGGKMFLNRLEIFDDLYRGRNYGDVNEMLLGLNQGGAPDRRLAPILNALSRGGMGLGQQRNIGGTLAFAQQDLGLSGSAAQQLTRYALRSPGTAPFEMTGAMGRMSAQSLGGAEAGSAAIADALSNTTGNYNLTDVTRLTTTAIGAAYRNHGTTPEQEVGPGAARYAGSFTDMAGSVGNVVGFTLSRTLLQRGLSWQATSFILSLVSQKNIGEAARAYARALNKPGDQATISEGYRLINGAMLARANLIESRLDSQLKRAAGKGYDAGASYAEGAAVPGNFSEALRDELGRGAAPGAMPASTPSGADAGAAPSFRSEAGREVETKEAQYQGQLAESLKKVQGDLGREIIKAIADGYVLMGKQIQDLGKEAQDDISNKGKPEFYGTKGEGRANVPRAQMRGR